MSGAGETFGHCLRSARSRHARRGGPTAIDTSFGQVLPSLAETRQVVAVEQRGHGHTADIARPLTFVRMTDDTAAFLRHLAFERIRRAATAKAKSASTIG